MVKRHEIRKTVNYSWKDEVAVWCRGVATDGFSIANPNFGMGWCESMDTAYGDQTTLRTYVYEVWTTAGQWVGWYPVSPPNVEFAYSVHGIPGSGPPPTPTNLTLTNPGHSFPDFIWNGSSGASSYTIYRKCDFGYHGDCTSALEQVGSTSSTSWVDYSVIQGGSGQQETYRYRIKAVNSSGSSSYSNEEVVNAEPSYKEVSNKGASELPEEFGMSQNYPNPFNPATNIKYQLPEQAEVRLDIYNILGRQVATLVNTTQPPGFYQTRFDGKGLASGLYIARLQAEGQSGKQMIKELKMQLVK